jgi:hypothetical protein
VIRLTHGHIFDDVQRRKVFQLIESRSYREADALLRPFEPLRPLYILMAWDQLAARTDYLSRRSLIENLWRAVRYGPQSANRYPNDECSERRLIHWCDRLSFHIELVDLVLERTPDDNRPPVSDQFKNDVGSRLLNRLPAQSILYALAYVHVHHSFNSRAFTWLVN